MTQIKRIFPILIFAIATLTLTSCDKREAIMKAISESDAAEIIESSLHRDSGGITSNIEDLTEQLVTAVNTGELCDSLYTTSIQKDHQGIKIQADYSIDFSYELTCNSLGIPQTATFSDSTLSIYSTSRISSEDDAIFTGNISGLQPSLPTINLQGNYTSNGTQELNFLEKKSISSTFKADLTNLEINKQSYNIISGSGTFSFTGSTPDENFSYIGNIVFNGNNTASLTINGTTYVIDWN